MAVWLHRPHDDRCVSREGCEDFSKETGAALTCLPPFFRCQSLPFTRLATRAADTARYSILTLSSSLYTR